MTVCEPDLKEERRLRREGHQWVAGLDEVGRGAWAGPLTVGVAVVRPRVQLRSMPTWLRDSKMLSEARREEIFGAVGKWLEAWSVGHATSFECDRWGMTEALRVAARRALAGLGQAPDALLIDGPVNLLRGTGQPAAAGVPSGADPGDPVLPDLASPGAMWSDSVWSGSAPSGSASSEIGPDAVPPDAVPPDAVAPDAAATEAIACGSMWSDPNGPVAGPSVPGPFESETFGGVVRPIVDGDAKCASVAAASVLAKVVRDRLMREEAGHYPGYDFDLNKGYPSPLHKTALRGYGPTAIHRRSWAFMDKLPWAGDRCRARAQGSCVEASQARLFGAL